MANVIISILSKLALIGIIGLTTAVSARAEIIEILPGIKSGQVFTWTYRRDAMRKQSGKADPTGSSITPVSLKVLEVRKDGFLVEWKYGPPRLLVDNKPLDPKAEKMSQASLEFLSKLRYEIELSPDGEFKGLRNFDEIKKVGLKFADEMDRGITKKPGSATIGDTMRAMIADRTILEAVLMKDIQILLFPLGKSFDSKIPFEFEGELPNPFGGQALLTRGVISIKVTDRAKGVAAIQFEQSLSPDSFPIFLESFADWAKLPKPKGDALKNVAANVYDKATYIVDLKTGLPVSVSYSRAITVPGQEKGETHTFSATEK